MKTLLKYITFGFLSVAAISCNDSQSDLLEPKVYFESESFRVEVKGESSMAYDLKARISSAVGSATSVTYALGNEEDVVDYNQKHGTEYLLFNKDQVSLETLTSTIAAGDLYAEKLSLQLNSLDAVQEGKTMLLPIHIQSSSLPLIESRSTVYLVINKPVRIMKALQFNSHGIKVGFPPGTIFNSVTYEALIHPTSFGDNNTIMGREGILIFRVGDLGGGLPRDIPQIAGRKEFKSPTNLEENNWYHMAFTYDQPSGKAVMYINGAKVAEATWDTPEFDFGTPTDFFIGKVVGFKWGERPFYGEMSEVRVWNVARSENQIRENMLTVDPQSDGLSVYYKMNGDDQVQEDGVWKIKDATGHGYDGVPYKWNPTKMDVVDLKEPIEIN